eukprot:GHVT01102858.1.p1 GENE.GHVT01102858.1~~GHVT01102858.1.p1  ORF type:complete len:104 (+),score=19.24 GHVT01102858.1:551-862(+)
MSLLEVTNHLRDASHQPAGDGRECEGRFDSSVVGRRRHRCGNCGADRGRERQPQTLSPPHPRRELEPPKQKQQNNVLQTYESHFSPSCEGVSFQYVVDNKKTA